MEKLEYIQTISPGLVGRNQDFRILNRPFRDLPLADEVRYTDDYLRELNKSSPIEEVLGKIKLPIGRDLSRRLYWALGNTPLENVESEDILRDAFRRSIVAGSWQPRIQVMSAKEPQQKINLLRKITMPKDRYTGPGYINPDPIGMAARFDLSDNGAGLHFTEPTVVGDTYFILVPTEHFVRFVRANFRKSSDKIRE